MIKYVATAMCLKAFSSGPLMRSAYRQIGNTFGGRNRATGRMPGYYAERIKRMLRLTKQHGLVRDGDRIFELGTGWLHWEALTLRLFFDIEAVLFDVWDNRQLAGLKNYVRQLGSLMQDREAFGITVAELTRAQSLIEGILKTESLEALYKLLGFQYVVESSGNLSRFPDNAFQLVVSAGVLEHVAKEAVPTLVKETHRILKPGGWASHSIDTSDHLAHYDAKVSKKLYLRFPERTWKRFFENEVQYINRVQRTNWLQLFRSSSFEIVEEQSTPIDLDGLKLAEDYAKLDRRDLECVYLRALLKKPADA